MEKIVYVTGNYGKYISVKESFEESGIEIDFYEHDYEEPDVNDIEYVSKEKAINAYKLLNKPCFVADSGFYIDNYPNNPGYPGAFVKRSGISTNVEKLLVDMKNIENRNCYFLDCLTFYDGADFYTFFGRCSGTISFDKRGDKLKKAKSDLWYVFVPNNCQKTLAEMDNNERKNRNDGRTSATDEFINWYKEKYLINQKKLIK
jgi:XTP/dITP diphosphohydrolase